MYWCVCIIILQEYESAERYVDRILQMEPTLQKSGISSYTIDG